MDTMLRFLSKTIFSIQQTLEAGYRADSRVGWNKEESDYGNDDDDLWNDIFSTLGEPHNRA